MAAVIAEFFQVIGEDMTPPANLAELIPYLIKIVIGVALVSGVFGMIGKVADIIINFRKW